MIRSLWTGLYLGGPFEWAFLAVVETGSAGRIRRDESFDLPPVEKLRVPRIGPEQVIGDHASRLSAEPPIDGGVEELVEMVVRKWLAAKLGDALEPPAIGEKDQKDRSGRHPGHVGDQVADRAAAGRVGDDEDVALLQVALGRRRERAGAQ